MEVQQMPSGLVLGQPTAVPLPGPRRADRTALVFWLLLGLHVLAWTLLPWLTQPNPPLDIVEMLYFGHEWQWGYFKHPPLVSWMAEAAYQLAGGRVWGVYLLAQLCVATCFWAVWRLARALLPPREALLAAMLPAACWYYNVYSTEFNNNVGMYPFWTLAILFAYWSLTDGRPRWWIATGATLGLGLLAKYTMAVLACAMLVFLVAHPALRRWWRRPGPYLALGAAMLVVQPHFLWAVGQGFPGIDFALARTQSAGRIGDHLLNPISFCARQAWALLPTALVLAAALGRPLCWRRPKGRLRQDRDFLWAMVLGPVALYVAISAVGGLCLRTFYGSQLWAYAGLAVLCVFRPRHRDGLRSAWIALGIVAAIFLVTAAAMNMAGPYGRAEGSRVHFPGRALGAQVDQLWRQRFPEPLPIVAGEWWLAGNAALYSADRPQVYGGSDPDMPNFDPRFSAWLSDAAVRRRGAVILWNADRFEGRTPSLVKGRFPGLEPLVPLELDWLSGARLEPVRIGVAVVPPASR